MLECSPSYGFNEGRCSSVADLHLISNAGNLNLTYSSGQHMNAHICNVDSRLLISKRSDDIEHNDSMRTRE